MKQLASSILLAMLCTASAMAQARLSVPADRMDFGIVPSGTVLTHHFWLHSVGNDTVTINDIKTGCSCAVFELEKKVLPPGDSVLLGIQWDTKRSMGAIYRSPLVFFNDSEESLRVHLSGNIWDHPDSARPVSAKPFRWELSRASVKDIDRIDFELINHSSEELAVSLLSLVPKQVELSLPQSLPANGKAKGFVRLLPEFRDAEFSSSITLLIGDRQNTHLTIPIRRKFY